MEEIMYSADFYVNEFPDKGVDYAKGFIEAFVSRPPKKLVDYLNEQDHFGKVSPEFQAVIIGEPRGSLFGKTQAAVLLVHSNFIAYTTTSDYTTPMGINYGYATFDNHLSVSEVDEALEMQIPYEAFYFGVGSISQEKDLAVVENLLEKNAHSMELFYEVSREREGKANRTSTPIVAPLPSGTTVNAPVRTEDEVLFPVEDTAAITEEPEATEDVLEEVETEPSFDEELAVEPETSLDEELAVEPEPEPAIEEEETEEEWGHILMEENRQGEMEEMKHLPAERKEQYPAAQARQEQPEEPKPKTRRERKTTEPVMDRRFKTDGPIISNNSIPEGFVFHEPVVYVNSVRPGLFKTSTARGAFTKAYQDCLAEIKDDIETGKFDAVFNLTYSAQSVENYFDVMVTGDAVVFE